MKGQALSFNTIVYITMAVIVLAVVIIIINGKMKGVKKDFEDRSEEYQDRCELAGSGRVCAVESGCENAGGSSLGSNFPDCSRRAMICCQY